MATSGVTTFNLTGLEVAQQATLVNGYRDPDEALSAADAETCRIHLNLMLKSWQADGCNLWREYEDTESFVSGDYVETLDPRVIDVMEARVVLSATNERPLKRWEWGQYVGLPNKTQSGDPTIFVIRKERAATKMIIWPVPTVTRTVNYTAARLVEDVSVLTNDIDVPQEWLETVVYGLSARLCEPLGVVVASPNTVARVQQRADDLYARMRDMDRPSSITFEPSR